MFSTIDKAWVSGVVSFVCQYVVLKFFGIDVSMDTQIMIVSALTAVINFVLTWAMPNKKPS